MDVLTKGGFFYYVKKAQMHKRR